MYMYMYLCIFQREVKLNLLFNNFHYSATFCLAHLKQLNICLKRILDSSTTHFDQVLPTKYLRQAELIYEISSY